MWVLGLLLDVEVDVVLLHVQIDGGRVAINRRVEAADRCSFARTGRVCKIVNRWIKENEALSGIECQQL